MTDPTQEVKTVVADAQAAEAKAVSLEAKAVAWVQANPKKVVTAILVVLALVLWKLL